jgi:phosphoglycerate kinase
LAHDHSLENLVSKIDVLIIGGGMANTFLAAAGAHVGASLQEADLHDTARNILKAAEAANCRVILPVDGRVARTFAAGAPHEIVALSADTRLEPDQMILDAGDQTVSEISHALAGLKTLIWNGPLGAFEIEPFDTATLAAAREAARLTASGDLKTIAGGGDTVAALNAAGVADAFTYISTAGGAFLEWMEGKTLPGVAALG